MGAATSGLARLLAACCLVAGAALGSCGSTIPPSQLVPLPRLPPGHWTDRAIPHIAFTDQFGRSLTLQGFRNKIVVLAPFFTLSQDDGPITTGAFAELQRSINQADLSPRVVLAEVTVDPPDDTPIMLNSYAKRVGVTWELLTGSATSLRKLWKAFRIYSVRVPESTPEDFNWLTGQTLDYDFDLSNAVIIIDSGRRERYFVSAIPDAGGSLPPGLANMLDEEGIGDLTNPRGKTWSPALIFRAVTALLTGRGAQASSSRAGSSDPVEMYRTVR